jgi:hypothetical protein
MVFGVASSGRRWLVIQRRMDNWPSVEMTANVIDTKETLLILSITYFSQG